MWTSQVRLLTFADPRVVGNGDPNSEQALSNPTPTRGGFRPITHQPLAVQPAAIANPDSTKAVLASFGQRFLASVIDCFLVIFVIAAVLPLFVNDFQARVMGGWQDILSSYRSTGTVGLPDDLVHLMSILNMVTIVATVLYGVLTLGLWSRTAGQRIVGIAVSPVGKPAERVGWSRGIARTLAWTLLSQGAGLLFYANLFSVTMIWWHPKRQTVPDLLAMTQVVRRA